MANFSVSFSVPDHSASFPLPPSFLLRLCLHFTLLWANKLKDSFFAFSSHRVFSFFLNRFYPCFFLLWNCSLFLLRFLRFFCLLPLFISSCLWLSKSLIFFPLPPFFICLSCLAVFFFYPFYISFSSSATHYFPQRYRLILFFFLFSFNTIAVFYCSPRFSI